MTVRTFTLKDFFNRDQAMAKMRAEQRRPFANNDLAGTGMTFVAMPEPAPAGAPTPPIDARTVVSPLGNQTEEQLRLARDWAARKE